MMWWFFDVVVDLSALIKRVQRMCCVVFVHVHERRSFLKISPLIFSSQILHKKIHIFFLFPFFPPKERRRRRRKKVTTIRRYDDVAVGDETGRATSPTASVVRARIESSSVVFSRSGDIIDNSESVVAE